VLRRTAHLAPLRDVQLLALAETLRTRPEVVERLVPDLSEPAAGGLRDLMSALELGDRLGEETAALNKVLRRTNSLEAAARAAADPALALAYLRAADKVIQVDDVPGPKARDEDKAGEGALSPPQPPAPSPAQPAPSGPPPSAHRPERTTPPRVPAT